MKKTILPALVCFLLSCNNEKAKDGTGPSTADTAVNHLSQDPGPVTTGTSTAANLTYTVDGTEISHNASILVSKDKDKLQAGAPLLCILTSNAAKNNNEYLTVNFLLDTKPGTYPVVGSGLSRGKDAAAEMFGGLLGGKPRLTENKVIITECRDLGENAAGGHKWSISGYWEGMVIKATPMMLMDKSKNHPAEVKLGKGTFTGLTFDDNWEEMMEKAMDQLKKKD